MATAGIYAIVNQQSGKMYIGSSYDTNRRWGAHRGYLRRAAHPNNRLQSAYAKYGSSAFSFEIVEYVDDRKKLIEREQVWIDFFKPAYNIRIIANSSCGLTPSAETRERMSVAQRGKRQSAETIEKRAAKLRGVPRSAETRAKIALSHIGIRPNAAVREKMAAAKRGTKRPRKAAE